MKANEARFGFRIFSALVGLFAWIGLAVFGMVQLLIGKTFDD